MIIERAKISDEQKGWFVQNYPNMRDAELAETLGVCTQTIRRMARRRGLCKTETFIRISQQRAVDAARIVNKGRHDPRCLEPLEKYHFRKGESTLQKYGKEIDDRRIANSTASRKALYKKEKARDAFGLPRQTNYRIGRQDPKRARVKWYLTRRGYHVDDNERIAYYDDNTKRGAITEKRNSKYYQFIYETK